MDNPRLHHLPDYAFPRLAALLDGLAPGAEPILLSLGEPQHPYPAFVDEILDRGRADYGRYPPIAGTAELRAAIAGWLDRRYGLPAGFLDPDRHVLPLSGTREGLFSIAFVAVPPEKGGRTPAVLMPNPFYQCYAAAALAAGAEPVYCDATRETGFLPDFAALPEAVPEDLLARTALVYLCSPANPQGAVASRERLAALLDLARRHDFLLALDECYSEIYTEAAPPGGLDAAAASGSLRNLVVFHSLSKRSNLPGLRAGFIAGDPEVIARFRHFRSYVGPAMPLPVQAAAAAVWRDEGHVDANRALYRAKFDAAERLLAGRFGFYRPAGGFFLWLDVGDGEAAARRLWAEAGVKVLPGAYLARDTGRGNPGARYVRLALVAETARVVEGLERLVHTLQ